MAKTPVSVAMILALFGFILFSGAAAHPGQPNQVAACVDLLFDPPTEPPPSIKRILCRDMLRTIGLTFKITGKLEPEYLEALEKLPRFKDDPNALKKFICRLSNAPQKFGCDGEDIIDLHHDIKE